MSKPTDEAAAISSPRHLLPKDLPNAIKHLSDEELDRLITAALAEMRQRGRRLPTDKAAPKLEPGFAKASLTRGQLTPFALHSRRASRLRASLASSAYPNRTCVRLWQPIIRARKRRLREERDAPHR